MEVKKFYNSPIGVLIIGATDDYITSLYMLDEKEVDEKRNTVTSEAVKIIDDCIKQLDEYFEGKRKVFDIKFKNIGTSFREKVWQELEKIPYGTTISYGELAVLVGNSKASRAVGGANHNNKISIIVPCHRVIGANGSLTGYGGGLWRKEWLLAHEKRF